MNLLHKIEITMDSSNTDFVANQKEPHVVIELYETHLLMISKFRHKTEDEKLGIMNESFVDDVTMIPRGYNITPKVDLVENEYYKFVLEPASTTPIFKTKEQAMEVFDKVVAWKIGALKL